MILHFVKLLTFAYVYVYVYVYVCICMYMYMYVYVCICMYMYVYVCICMYMYVYVCICICILGRGENPIAGIPLQPVTNCKISLMVKLKISSTYSAVSS